jgi:hypothetical protein
MAPLFVNRSCSSSRRASLSGMKKVDRRSSDLSSQILSLPEVSLEDNRDALSIGLPLRDMVRSIRSVKFRMTVMLLVTVRFCD